MGRSARGVTLVEVMLTVAIALAITALGLSNLSGTLQSARDKSAVAEVRGHLEEARSLARSLLQPVTVTLGDGTITLQPATGEPRVYSLSRSLSQLSFDSPTGTLAFNASGGTDLAGPVSLTIKTARGLVYHLKIYPAIGAVRVA